MTIEDTGIGIPTDALSKIGQPFEQVQNQLTKSGGGSGLGLAISRSLAELHGGSLKITSKQGAGTRVSVRIPLDNDASLDNERLPWTMTLTMIALRHAMPDGEQAFG